MARSDLLVALVKAASSGDGGGVRSAAGAIATEARGAGHRLLAAKLEAAMAEEPLRLPLHQAPAGDDVLALAETVPRFELADLVLPTAANRRLRALVDEQRRKGDLIRHGLEPRHRVLVSGPPGNGKTSVAEALARSLGRPLLVVRYYALVGSRLGETNRRLDALFRAAAARPCVLFFDEFEAVGKERGDGQETGEIKRVVASLLLNIDALPSHVVVVAATNHPEMLDRAVWRRFQIKIDLPSPDSAMLADFLSRRLRLANADELLDRACRLLTGASFAEAEELAQDVRRRKVLAHGAVSTADALGAELDDRHPQETDWTLDASRRDAPAPEAQPAVGGREGPRRPEGDTGPLEVPPVQAEAAI